MKVAVQCESPLLQRSLELFLRGHLSSLRQCDVVIRDFISDDESRPSLYISSDSDADIVKPFSRSQLMLAIEGLAKKNDDVSTITRIAAEMETDAEAVTDAPAASREEEFSILERRIEKLTQEYQKNIIEAIRAFYEK